MMDDSEILIAYLDFESNEKLTDEDIQIMKNNFEWYDPLKTYVVNFHYDPLYSILNARYRKRPGLKGYSEQNGLKNLENYLNENIITTMDYFDYLGERIYKCIGGEEIGVANPDIFNKFCFGIKKYLEKANIDQHHLRTFEEVNKLLILSDIALKYGLKINFFDENWV